MSLVLDTSVTMAWCFADEVTPFTEQVYDRVVDNAATVPAVWLFEVANALAIGERRGRLTGAQRLRFTTLLRALPITIEEPDLGRTLGSVVELANAFGLSAYDASYLDLALRAGLPLATQDVRLRAAAQQSGIAVIQ